MFTMQVLFAKVWATTIRHNLVLNYTNYCVLFLLQTLMWAITFWSITGQYFLFSLARLLIYKKKYINKMQLIHTLTWIQLFYNEHVLN